MSLADLLDVLELVIGDPLPDPTAEAVRSRLDAHIAELESLTPEQVGLLRAVEADDILNGVAICDKAGTAAGAGPITAHLVGMGRSVFTAADKVCGDGPSGGFILKAIAIMSAPSLNTYGYTSMDAAALAAPWEATMAGLGLRRG